MAIDKSNEYWTGTNSEDIIQYLNDYSEDTIDDSAIIKCKDCGSDVFRFQIDTDEGAIKITCENCKKQRFILDSEEYWEDSEPEKAKCSLCNNYTFNIGVGFCLRPNKSVKWVYIGNRCTRCSVLGSYGDWGIDYEPTDIMKNNI